MRRHDAQPRVADPPLIAHVIHHLQMGGMENGLVNLINRMDRQAYRHAVVCIEDASDFRRRIVRPEVEVICMERSRIGVWPLRRALYRWFRARRPAIVHARNLSGLDALAPAALAGVRVRLVGEHGRDESDPDGLAKRPALLRRLHRPLVHRYVVVSKDIGRYLEQRVGVPSQRIEHVCNGVDADRFSPRGPSFVSPMPAPFTRPGAWVIGTVGRAQPVKSQMTLLQAFERLCGHPDVASAARTPMLAIIGDGPLLADLRAAAAARGLADRIWLPGARDDVPELLRSFDLFVLPSMFEGISNTLLEAMATGLPVIATHVGGNTELVDEGLTGSTFPVGAVDVLADGLLSYFRDPGMLQRHAQGARRAALDRFSLEAMVAQYRAIYDAALLTGRAPPGG